MLATIDRVCEASAILCKKLEARAIQVEFEEKQRNDPKNWSALRRDYEAFKSIKKLITGPHEEIREDFVRESLARHLGIKPEEVTPTQINFEVTGLLRDYPAIRLVHSKTEIETVAEASPGTSSVTKFRVLDESYQSIEFEGDEYHLTPTQSTVIRILHRAYLDKRNGVGFKEIQQALGIHSGKMSDWFRGRNKTLFGKLINKTSRHHYYLNL